MKRRNLSTLFGLVILASMILAACNGGAATEEPQEPLIVGTTDSWTSFESAWVYSFHDWELSHQCADGLLNAVPGTAGEVELALAESYTVSDDGLEYTFKLREGVTFPNGDPFDADAVIFSFDRVAPIDEAEGANAGFLYTAYAEGTEKIDDMTVKVTFNAPYPFAPQLISTNVWKIHNPNEWSATEAGTENTACGIGPYVMSSFTEGEEAIFEVNESYYGTPPKTDKIIVRYFADSPTMALALQNGEIDVAWKSLSPADQEALTVLRASRQRSPVAPKSATSYITPPHRHMTTQMCASDWLNCSTGSSSPTLVGRA